MKLIDFRVESTSTAGVLTVGPSVFRHNLEDKVSDLQFNPSPSLDKQFASGSETGLVTVKTSFYFSLSYSMKDMIKKSALFYLKFQSKIFCEQCSFIKKCLY